MKTIKTIFLLFLTISCSYYTEEDVLFDSKSLANSNFKEGVMNFSTNQELVEFMNESAKLSKTELQAKENNLGFMSFARRSKQIYDVLYNKVINNIYNKDSVLKYVKKHNKYLEISKDKSGDEYILRKMIKNPYSFAVNDNKIVNLNSKILKVFNKNEIISTDLKNYSDLKNVKNIADIPSSIDFEYLNHSNNIGELNKTLSSNNYIEDCIADDDTRLKRQKTDGNLRIRVYYEYVILGGITASAWLTAEPYKKILGVWFPVERTITTAYHFKVVRRGVSSEQTVTFSHLDTVKFDYFAHYKTLFSYNDAGDYKDEESLYFWGDIPSVPPAVFSCNRDIVCNIEPCYYPYEFSACDGVICPTGYYCSGGLCIEEPDDPGNDCSFPCPINYECVNGECVPGDQQ